MRKHEIVFTTTLGNLDDEMEQLRLDAPPYVPQIGSKVLFKLPNGRSITMEVEDVHYAARSRMTVIYLDIPNDDRYQDVGDWQAYLKRQREMVT